MNGMLKRDAQLGTIFGGNLGVVPEWANLTLSISKGLPTIILDQTVGIVPPSMM